MLIRLNKPSLLIRLDRLSPCARLEPMLDHSEPTAAGSGDSGHERLKASTVSASAANRNAMMTELAAAASGSETVGVTPARVAPAVPPPVRRCLPPR